MRIFGVEIRRQRKAADSISLDTLIRRLEAAFETSSGVSVTPETAMQAPTVHAIVTSISRTIASLPLHVLRKTEEANGLSRKEKLPAHPVQRLLNRPNDWQSRTDYWLDATSWLVRYGNFYAFKSRGSTGPVRQLLPLPAGDVTVEQDEEWNVIYKVAQAGRRFREYGPGEIHHARGPARNGVKGDSPVIDVREAIALEIAAERFGASFFGNGAFPALVFRYRDGWSGFKNAEEERAFIEDFQEKFTGRGRFRSILPPPGLELADPISIQNDKAQFLETRKAQRTVIAGAFGVPPHIVGDLERSIHSNIEQQSLDYVQKLALPTARTFEAAMERDLLTEEDRRGGVIIRFNLDGLLRGDFKSRQEGLKIQREMGVINPNEWRDEEGRNPISETDGGATYWAQGPSGQTGAEDSDEENA